jgi:hypothetical protein
MNKDSVEMNKDKEHLKKLKGLVNNHQQWEQFSNYIDDVIAQQHRAMEQTDNDKVMYRAQGAIYQLRRLKLLRDEVLKHS